MIYKASLDSMTKVISLIVIFVFLFVAFKNAESLAGTPINTKPDYLSAGIILVMISALLFGYLFSIKNYTLENGKLTINRPIGNKSINIAEITEVRPVHKDELSGSIRTFGNGGFFGYYGKYYNRKLGHMTLYTTQTRNRILIRTTRGQKIIISPDDLSLVEKLKSYM